MHPKQFEDVAVHESCQSDQHIVSNSVTAPASSSATSLLQWDLPLQDDCLAIVLTICKS